MAAARCPKCGMPVDLQRDRAVWSTGLVLEEVEHKDCTDSVFTRALERIARDKPVRRVTKVTKVTN